MSDYGEYNGDAVHDMWVDYTYEQCTSGPTGRLVGKTYGSRRQRQLSTKEQIDACRSRIASNEKLIANLKADIERTKSKIANPKIHPQKELELKRLLNKVYPKRLGQYRKKVNEDEALLVSLLIKREKERNLYTILICIFAIIISSIVFPLIF